MLKTDTRPPDETIILLHDTTEMITAPLDTATNATDHPATETESVAATVEIVTESEKTAVKNDIAKKIHHRPIIEAPTEKAVVEITPPLVVAAIPRVK